MSFNLGVNLYGVSAAIQELGRIDPELRRAARTRLRQAAEPVVNRARAFTPADAPMSGWERGSRTQFTARARTGIKSETPSPSSRKGRDFIPLLRIVQANAAGAIFEFAGKTTSGVTPAGRNFVKVLNERNGRAPRALWRAVDQMTPELEAAVQAAVHDIDQLIGD